MKKGIFISKEKYPRHAQKRQRHSYSDAYSAPCLFIIFLAPSASHFHGLFFISDYYTQQKTAFLFLSLVPVNP
jgi:hypothetical protein